MTAPHVRPRTSKAPYVLESPLVPDGSAPGTQSPVRPERPLTRRELRERERAVEAEQGDAGVLALFETPGGAGAPVAPAPAAAPIASAPAAAVRAACAPVAPVQLAPAIPAAVPVAAAVAQIAMTHAAPTQPASATPESAPARVTAPAAQAAAVAPAQPAAPQAAPAPVRAAEASGFDSLFDDLLVAPAGGDAPVGTSTRPIVLPEATIAAPAADAPATETRRSRAAAEPARRGGGRRRGAEVPAAPRGRNASARPGNAAFASSSVPASKPAGPQPGRIRRRAARMTTLVAMSFAALLAVATSVPSLSLLSPADVQAMALTGSDSGRQPGQTLDTSGDAIASPSVGLESYKSQTISEYAEAAGIRAEATFTNNPNGTIQWPFAVGVHIGDRFGYRDCAGCSSDHHGQDFNPGYGAEIQAIADGVVSQSTDNGGSLGTVMMIDHMIDGQVVTSVYAHMISGSRRFEVGDAVKVGDVVGQTGNTGMSTGPHLHFEIRLGGVNGTWTDPLEWLYANTN